MLNRVKSSPNPLVDARREWRRRGCVRRVLHRATRRGRRGTSERRDVCVPPADQLERLRLAVEAGSARPSIWSPTSSAARRSRTRLRLGTSSRGVVEVEQRLDAVAVVDEPVERRENVARSGTARLSRRDGFPSRLSSSAARRRAEARRRGPPPPRVRRPSPSRDTSARRDPESLALPAADDGDDAAPSRIISMSATWRLAPPCVRVTGVTKCCAISRDSSGPEPQLPEEMAL